MNAKTVLPALFFLNCLCSFGQSGLIKFTTEGNPDGTVSIFANSQAYVEYTAKLSFSSLSGFISRSLNGPDAAIVTVNPGNSEVMKFTREKAAGNYSIQYKTQYFAGRSLRKMPDTGFRYLLPTTAGNNLRVVLLSSTISFLSQKLKTESRGTGFLLKLGDTICASRAGVVYESSDTAKGEEKPETIFRQGRNRIQLLQRDGTIGIYSITAPIKLLVSPGDEVFPGQPMAVITKETEKSLLYLLIAWLDAKKLENADVFDNTHYYNYVPVYFYGSDEEQSTLLEKNKVYTARHPKEIIMEEMSKREKKKLGF